MKLKKKITALCAAILLLVAASLCAASPTARFCSIHWILSTSWPSLLKLLFTRLLTKWALPSPGESF